MDIRITEKSSESLDICDAKKVVGTQIPHSLYLKLKAEAEEEFMSISDLLRKIIFTYYKDRKEN